MQRASRERKNRERKREMVMIEEGRGGQTQGVRGREAGGGKAKLDR